MLVNGTSLDSESIVIEKESVKLNIDGKAKSITKAEILCIIPEGKTGYTFWEKNKNKKMKIKKKDIFYNYEDTDIPRIFAYKYLKTSYTASKLYRLNSNSSLSEADFTSIFNEQDKKLRSRLVTGYIAGGIAFAIGLSSFLGSVAAL